MTLSGDARGTARLLFGPELAGGRVTEADLDVPAVAAALPPARVPALPRRVADLVAQRGGRRTHAGAIAGALAARRAVLGDDAAAPPRVLVRVDEFPHYRAWDEPAAYGTDEFRRFAAILAEAGVPYLLAVVPRVPRAPLDPRATAWRPHDDGELAMLAELAADPRVSTGVHGLDHRTRHADPRRHSELTGLGADELRERLSTADATLAALGLGTDVFVAPYNRFGTGQYRVLAERYAVVTGGPETVAALGWQPTPQVRDGAVYLPAYAPLYGRAGTVRAGLEPLIASGTGLLTPVVLHWGWERDDGWADLRALAGVLAEVAVGWDALRR